MPRVLHLYNMLSPATERTWLDCALGLDNRGFSADIACENVTDDVPPLPADPAILKRVHVEPADDIDAQMNAIASDTPERDPTMQRLLAEPIDLVHGHLGTRVLHAAPWLKRGVPTVLSLYGYDASRLLRDPCWIERYQWAADHGATFIALSRFMRDHLIDLGLPADAIRVIRLGVDLRQWRYDPAPAPPTPRFVFVGRLTPKKAPADLLHALARLRHQAHPDAVLDIIGDGPLREELTALTATLDIESAVRWHGALPREVVADHLRHATAFTLPSVTAEDGDCEGTPIVLMEALAIGVPCVTTQHAGIPEVLPPAGRSLTAPERDPDALADRMAAAAALPAADRRSLQEAGRAWIERQYALESTLASYGRLYRRLLAGRLREKRVDRAGSCPD